jgi:hypothetical protein
MGQRQRTGRREEAEAVSEQDTVPPGYFRAAAGNLVREDDPLAVAFRELAGRISGLHEALSPLLAVRQERISAMHRDYRRRQLARRRRR